MRRTCSWFEMGSVRDNARRALLRALVSRYLRRCIKNSMENILTDIRVLRAHRIEGTLPGSVVRTY